MPVGITTNVNCGLGKSKSKGQPGNLVHNRREFDPYNIDPNLAVNNILFANRSLKETYEVAFGDSIDEHNSKQKRKDRISYTRDNYFKYSFGADPNSVEANAVLMSNKRGKNSVKSFNEMVVQIGDCKEFGNFMRDEYDNFIDKNGNKVKWDKSSRNYYDVDVNVVSNSKTLIANPKAEKARDMLEIYYKGGRYNKVGNGVNSRLEKVSAPDIKADFELPSFEKRNPNFAVACSVMHNDEWHGTPHLHIDFVPIGEGYKKGPEKQLGFERALACMGFTDRITAFYEWRDKERQILKDICNCYGIETKTKAEEQADYRGETLPVDVYSNAMRDAKADAEVIKESTKIAAKHIRKEAEFQADKMRTQAQETLDTANSKAQEITATAEKKAEVLRSENNQLTAENDTLRKDKESYSKTDKYTKPDGYYVSDFNDALQNLFSDSSFSGQIADINSNKDTVNSLMKQLKNPPEEYKDAYEALSKFYDAYISLTNLATDPTGSLQTFSQNFNDADNETLNCYNALKMYLEE